MCAAAKYWGWLLGYRLCMYERKGSLTTASISVLCGSVGKPGELRVLGVPGVSQDGAGTLVRVVDTPGAASVRYLFLIILYRAAKLTKP
jgi:hypothetical protein